MAIKYWDKMDFDTATFDGTKIAVVDGALKLRRKDASGKFSMEGLYEQADFVLHNYQASALLEYFAFEMDAKFDLDDDENELGTITWQLSNDGGSTYQYWNGSAWATAGVNDFNTEDEVTEHIGSFAVGSGRQLRLKGRMTPSADFEHTPLFYGVAVAIQFEPPYVYFEDMYRSLKRYLDAHLRVKRLVVQTMPAAGTTVTLVDKFLISSVYSVYNLTTDPGRLTNIFLSSVGQVVTMTGSQALGDEIEVTFFGTVPIYISADPDIELTELPAVAIRVRNTDEQRAMRRGGSLVEKNLHYNTARLRDNNLYVRSAVQLHCLAEDQIPSSAMLDGIRSIFEYRDVFTSLATGFPFAIMDLVPQRDNNRVSEGLYDATVSIDISGIDPQLPYRTGTLAQELRVGVGGLTGRPDDEEVISG